MHSCTLERGLLVLSSTVTAARLRLLQLFTCLKVKFHLCVQVLITSTSLAGAINTWQWSRWRHVEQVSGRRKGLRLPCACDGLPHLNMRETARSSVTNSPWIFRQSSPPPNFPSLLWHLLPPVKKRSNSYKRPFIYQISKEWISLIVGPCSWHRFYPSLTVVTCLFNLSFSFWSVALRCYRVASLSSGNKVWVPRSNKSVRALQSWGWYSS